MSQIFTATQMEIVTELVNTAAKNGAKRALEEVGITKKTITLAQIRRLHGSVVALEARYSPKIKWVPKSEAGTRSGVYCSMAEFDNFLFNKDFSFYAPKL
jgi:hypothetical protein